MGSSGGTVPFVVVSLILGSLAILDLHRVEVGALTIYTTAALRDLIEKDLAPRWREESPLRLEPVYVAAGEEYNRLRMSGSHPEADVFMHASPLFLEKGLDEGYMVAISPERARRLNDTFHGDLGEHGGTAWYAFAWSPLVQVYAPRFGSAPDLARTDLRFGLAHPTLSNNGIYSALFFETLTPGAGERLRAQTVVQPVNARTNILGVADGSFDVTLGYEAVAKFFQGQGARVVFEPPLLEGRRVSTAVIFCVALVNGPHPDEARRFVDFLFTNETQAALDRYHFRSVYNADPAEAFGGEVEMILFDWSDWAAIERVLPRYEVRESD